jgi:Flp pilus assembly protein TadD
VQALAATGQVDEAAARLERLSLPPRTDAASLLVVGNTALQLRRPDLALRFLDRGIAQDPRMAVLHEKRGVVLVMLQRPAEARAELEEARRLDPASASVCLNLAVLEAQEGRLGAARALALEALRRQPDYPQARGLLQALERPR